MEYQEFLRMTGASEKGVSFFHYRLIESLYLNRDDLFPTKKEVVEHYHRFGTRGFSSKFIEKLDALRAAIAEVRDFNDSYSFKGCTAPMLRMALTTAAG